MSIVNLCPSSALTKSEKINEEKDQTYWIRKAEELEATTVLYMSTPITSTPTSYS